MSSQQEEIDLVHVLDLVEIGFIVIMAIFVVLSPPNTIINLCVVYEGLSLRQTNVCVIVLHVPYSYTLYVRTHAINYSCREKGLVRFPQ